MSKSAKKRKQAEKRRSNMVKLREASSLLDDEASPMKPLESSPIPEKAMQLARNYRKVSTADDENDVGGRKKSVFNHVDTDNKEVNLLGSSDGLSTKTKQIDFVLPRSNGKVERYFFDKQARGLHKNELTTIIEENTPLDSVKSKAKKEESLDEILFPNKRLKLADKFEAVHRAEESKRETDGQRKQMTNREEDVATKEKDSIPSSSLKEKKKKKKRQRSSSLDKDTQRNSGPSHDDDQNQRRPSSDSKLPISLARSRNSTGASMTAQDVSRSKSDVLNRQLSGRSVEQAVQDKQGLRPRANSTDGELNLPQRGLCDEQMVLRSHQWQDQHLNIHHVTPRGFVNLGNTCFLNSILQCLAYSPPFCQSLIAISEMKRQQTQNGTKPKQNQGQRITSYLSTLFQKVHGSLENSANSSSIAPQVIVKALPSLGSIGSRNGYKFWPGRQEDAHEFLVHLLDAMHDGELRAAGINQHLSGWRDRLPVTRLDETTFIHRIFGGYFRSQVRCKACGYCSNTYDPFLDLSLEVSKNTSNSILNALSEFTRKETLDANNQWKCSGCKRYVCPTKQLTVFRPPLSLCIQLKRFAFVGGVGSRPLGGGGWKYGKSSPYGGRSKITKPVEFPADLALPLSDGRSCSYSLTGVVIHVGGNASSGHYTAYVRKPGRTGNAQWYHADDSFVEPVSEKTVLRQKDAYILFYCRKEVKLEFPSPPPRDMSTEEAREFGRARARARADSNAMQEEVKSKKKPSPIPDPSTRTRVDIHPLAEFLNARFQGTMSPDPKTTSVASQYESMTGLVKKTDATGDVSSRDQSNQTTSFTFNSGEKQVSVEKVTRIHSPKQMPSQVELNKSMVENAKLLLLSKTDSPGGEESQESKMEIEEATVPHSSGSTVAVNSGQKIIAEESSSDSESDESETEVILDTTKTLRRSQDVKAVRSGISKQSSSESESDGQDIDKSKPPHQSPHATSANPGGIRVQKQSLSESESDESEIDAVLETTKTPHQSPHTKVDSSRGKKTTQQSLESESDGGDNYLGVEEATSPHRAQHVEAAGPVEKDVPEQSSSDIESDDIGEEQDTKSPHRSAHIIAVSPGVKVSHERSSSDSESDENEADDITRNIKVSHRPSHVKAASTGGRRTQEQSSSDSECDENEGKHDVEKNSPLRSLYKKAGSPEGEETPKRSSSVNESNENETEDVSGKTKSQHRSPLANTAYPTKKVGSKQSLSESEYNCERGDVLEKKKIPHGSHELTKFSSVSKKTDEQSSSGSESDGSDEEYDIEETNSPLRSPHAKATSPVGGQTLEQTAVDSKSDRRESDVVPETTKTPQRLPNAKVASSEKKKTPNQADMSSESNSTRNRENEVLLKSANKGTTTPDVKDGGRTRVVVGNADSRGKVKVMIGPKKRKAWEPKASSIPQKGSAFQLLGNLGVSKWDDDEEKINKLASTTATVPTERDRIVQKMEKQEKSRKRKMHLDRWDALLDQGKTKKVKKAQDDSSANNNENPKQNVFQRIQSGIQRMNKGKAKGLFRRTSGEGSALSNRRRGSRY